MSAAVQCLRGTSDTAKLGATLLMRAKRFSQAGTVFEALGTTTRRQEQTSDGSGVKGVGGLKEGNHSGLLEKAAKAFEKAGMVSEQGRCLLAAGHTDKALEVKTPLRKWEEFILNCRAPFTNSRHL